MGGLGESIVYAGVVAECGSVRYTHAGWCFRICEFIVSVWNGARAVLLF